MKRIWGCVCAAAVMSAGMASAEGLNFSTKNRTGLFKSQIHVLDNRASTQYANSVRYQPLSLIHI